jgi:hypothetical protein
MNPEEQVLMNRAHRLALAQKEVNLLPKLLGLQGDEKQRAKAQLAAIRSERDHLDALLRQDPNAVTAEQERLNEGLQQTHAQGMGR